MRVKPFVVLLVAGALAFVAAEARAQERWRVDVENGAAISGYNDVGIPGNTGTRFSMTDDLKSDTEYLWRVRADFRSRPETRDLGAHRPAHDHVLGYLRRPVDFAGATYRPGRPCRRHVDVQLVSRDVPLRAVPQGHLDVRVRRDRQGPRRGDSTRVEWAVGREDRPWRGAARQLQVRAAPGRIARPSFVEGDALAAPQGRAEDVFAGIVVDAGRQWSIKAGYRFLEGGADNDEVYTFAAVHYVAAGVVFRF